MSIVLQWTPSDFSGLRWIPKNSSGLRWIPMDSKDFNGVSRDPVSSELRRTPSDSDGLFRQNPTGSDEIVLIPPGVHFIAKIFARKSTKIFFDSEKNRKTPTKSDRSPSESVGACRSLSEFVGVRRSLMSSVGVGKHR